MESHIDEEEEMNTRDHLPTELISDILSRLPVKTLFRFKCVCKLWCNLISNPYFHHLHRELSQKRKPLQLFSTYCYDHENKGNEAFFHLSSVDDNGKPHDECILSNFWADYIISSHNSSLVCFVSITEDAHVFNPGTNEILTLPKGSHCAGSRHNNYMVGFGYLPLSNEYKVVRLFIQHLESLIDEYFYNFEIRCEILTLGDGGFIGPDGDARPPPWRVLEDELCPYPVSSYPPPFVNEAVHWKIHYEYYELHTDELHDNGELIVSFNVRTEKFKMILKPKGCSSKYYMHVVLEEVRGFLVLVSCGESCDKLDIWFLKDYENQLWLKEYRIDLMRIDCFNPNDFTYAVPRDIKDGELLIEMDVAGMRLGYYNIKTHSFRRVIIPKSRGNTKFNYYRESFFSLGTR